MIVEGKRVLVIGGTGSMGRVLVRRLLSGEAGRPASILVLSRDDARQQALRRECVGGDLPIDATLRPDLSRVLQFRLGDIRRYDDVCAAVRDADIVANAAALKQVPACEYAPTQAIATNCLGPANIVRAIVEHRYPVETVIGISTDKAAKPVNVMGMTKALQERILVAANTLAPATRFIGVRCGNLLASQGSVVPLFLEQIRNGGPLTVTSPQMTRFLLSSDGAVDTIFAALRQARAGETFVPIVESSTVERIAQAMVGDRPIRIEVIGIRPGEKVHEILVGEEECRHTHRQGDFYVIRPMLPELAEPAGGPSPEREYSSADHLLELDATRALLQRNGLLPPG